jgi:hypothetical protein
MQKNVENLIQPQHCRKTNHFIERCEIWRTSFNVKVLPLIEQPHFALERIRMTTTHLILNGARIVALKCYGSMPRVWNGQMANIIVEQYNNASFHDGVIDIVP